MMPRKRVVDALIKIRPILILIENVEVKRSRSVIRHIANDLRIVVVIHGVHAVHIAPELEIELIGIDCVDGRVELNPKLLLPNVQSRRAVVAPFGTNRLIVVVSLSVIRESLA